MREVLRRGMHSRRRRGKAARRRNSGSVSRSADAATAAAAKTGVAELCAWTTRLCSEGCSEASGRASLSPVPRAPCPVPRAPCPVPRAPWRPAPRIVPRGAPHGAVSLRFVSRLTAVRPNTGTSRRFGALLRTRPGRATCAPPPRRDVLGRGHPESLRDGTRRGALPPPMVFGGGHLASLPSARRKACAASVPTCLRGRTPDISSRRHRGGRAPSPRRDVSGSGHRTSPAVGARTRSRRPHGSFDVEPRSGDPMAHVAEEDSNTGEYADRFG